MKVQARQRGFTLVETMIVAALSALLLLGAVMLAKSSNDSYESVQEDTTANFSLRRALTLISDDMRQSNTMKIVVTDNDSTAWDRLDLQVPVSYAASAITWGAAGTADWHERILVEDGWLIRRVVDATGTPQRTDEVLARDVDGFLNGEKGFAVTTADGLYCISLRVTLKRGTRVWRRTETTSVQVRN